MSAQKTAGDDQGSSIPSANSPRLLGELLEHLGTGVRSTRGLQEALGVDGRTVRYYKQAAAWLGFLTPDERAMLTDTGLRYVYDRHRRPSIYRQAVWSQPFVTNLMTGRRGDLPSLADVERAIAVASPELAPATIRRKASSVRALVAPGLKAGRPTGVDQPRQLELPLASRSNPPSAPRLSGATSRENNPDVYRYLLQCLLDVGELTLGQIRALLDRAEAGETPIGGFVDLALARGDAHRIDERLVVSAGAVRRRDMASTTASVILSDARYRTYLADAELAHAGDRQADIRRAKAADGFSAWDRRLFGHPLQPAEVHNDLDRILMDRSLGEFPLARPTDDPPEVVSEPFLYIWRQSGLILALPSYLAQLQRGVAGANAALHSARHAPGVTEPSLATRPVVVHGGILHPGERLPRSVPDARTLRHRVVFHSPYPAMVVALLLAHRSHPRGVELVCRSEWEVHREGKPVGQLLQVLDAFALSRQWLPCRRLPAATTPDTLLATMEAIGLVRILSRRRAVLDERFFVQLRTEAEEMEIAEFLVPLSRVMATAVLDNALADVDALLL